VNSANRRTLLRNAPGGGRELTELLQLIAVAELLRPSRRLWLAAPVLADAPVLDNRAGGFTALEPSWGEHPIGLLELLARNLAFGGEVIAVTADAADPFLGSLRAAGGLGRLTLRSHPSLAVQGIAGDDYFLAGALSWTPAGAAVAEEGVMFEGGPGVGEAAAARFTQAYGEAHP
jgi:hypothetical protein